MKKLLTVTLFSLSLFTSHLSLAQWVTIPDAKFAEWLVSKYPTCMRNGNEMDTTCSGIVNATIVDVSYKSISDLKGIQYFDRLKALNCPFNYLTILPALPDSLQSLTCSSNSLSSLPFLPATLTTLVCTRNPLKTLPTLPSSLRTLYCVDDSLTNISNLPSSLKELHCGENKLTSLPNPLPDSLTELYCNNNPLFNLTVLPNSLRVLYCNSNSLTSLPILPNSLTYLSCAYNSLTSISNLPDSLYRLDCYANKLSSLPILPQSVQWIDCRFNKLNDLPPLPDSLVYFDCSYNNGIKCLPVLKKFISKNINLNLFKIDGTAIKCLSNRIEHPYLANLPAIDTIPLCDVFNINGCDLAWNIQGTVFKDDNSDCLQQNGEQAVNSVKMNLYESGSLIESGIFVHDYSFDTKLSTYTVEVDTNYFPFIVSCPLSGDTILNVTANDSLKYNINFALKCKMGFDIGVWDVQRNFRFFPGDTTKVYSSVGDIVKSKFNASCSNGIGGQVKIILSGPAKYNVPLPGALTPTISGDTLVYTVPDFSLVNAKAYFAFSVVTNTTATIGDQVCFEVFVTPTTGDNNVSNNYLKHCFEVRNSFDPNEKEVSPVGNLDYPFNDWLTYTVHFQNTGNDLARHIQILDTLDSNIEPRSFELLSYSVMPMVQIKGNEVAFNFVNIMLPDSTTNKEGSKGYVSYRVKPTANLPAGTSLKNKAFIYFDFNAPIVTNETVNTISFPTSVSSIDWSSSISVYPNPSSDKITVAVGSGTWQSVEIKNVLGQTVLTVEKEDTRQDSRQIDVSGLTRGIYFLNIKSGNINTTKKLIKY